jgi:hypothetical protein
VVVLHARRVSDRERHVIVTGVAYTRAVSPHPAISLAEATRTWMRIGLLSFGGPAGQIAVMHRILVEEKKWIDEPRFLHALNYCMLLPGCEYTRANAWLDAGRLMIDAR